VGLGLGGALGESAPAPQSPCPRAADQVAAQLLIGDVGALSLIAAASSISVTALNWALRLTRPPHIHHVPEIRGVERGPKLGHQLLAHMLAGGEAHGEKYGACHLVMMP